LRLACPPPDKTWISSFRETKTCLLLRHGLREPEKREEEEEKKKKKRKALQFTVYHYSGPLSRMNILCQSIAKTFSLQDFSDSRHIHFSDYDEALT